jgi:hypothetical protein
MFHPLPLGPHFTKRTSPFGKPSRGGLRKPLGRGEGELHNRHLPLSGDDHLVHKTIFFGVIHGVINKFASAPRNVLVYWRFQLNMRGII